MVRCDAAYFSERALLMRVVALVFIVPPACAELALLEHGALFELVGLTVTPPAWRSAWQACVVPLVVQLLAGDAYLGVGHAGDFMSSVDACHYAFVRVGLG
jgi:hypothetical protein